MNDVRDMMPSIGKNKMKTVLMVLLVLVALYALYRYLEEKNRVDF